MKIKTGNFQSLKKDSALEDGSRERPAPTFDNFAGIEIARRDHRDCRSLVQLGLGVTCVFARGGSLSVSGGFGVTETAPEFSFRAGWRVDLGGRASE